MALTEEEPSFDYRTVAGLLAMNKNTVQRIFQLKGWQVRKRAVGWSAPDRGDAVDGARTERALAMDLCQGWGGRDGWLTFAFDCNTRRLLGWHLSRTGKASNAVAALDRP